MGEKFIVNRVVLAAFQIRAMKKFYSLVFDYRFVKEVYDDTILYSGKIGEMAILLCPNELANVNAEQNRHQFEFIVSDLELISNKVIEGGGSLQGGITNTETGKSLYVKDPDGNSIVFVEEKQLVDKKDPFLNK